MVDLFIEQTAKDYDLPYWMVEKAYKDNKDTLYAKLEEILIERQN